MKSSPIISVIIPNYNHASYLDERIQSVLNQTYQNFEVIILDDKSTDNSLEIIENYKGNSHISKIVINNKNSGSAFKQWIKGIELAKGDFIWIAESDDLCTKNFLETLVSRCHEYPNILTFCHSHIINEKGEIQDNSFQDSLKESFNVDGADFINKYLVKSNIVQNASSALFSKDAALKVSKEFTNYRGAGDWIFWIEIAKQGRVCYVHDILNFFRLHENNTTLQEIRGGKQEFEIKKVYDYMLKNHIIDKKKFNTIRNKKLNYIYYHRPFDEITNKEILKTWNADLLFYTKKIARKIINKIKRQTL